MHHGAASAKMEETSMKSNDCKRDAKKKPLMTMKEKKAAKNAKKAALLTRI